jgi:3-hydroxymyristoyl/3-hydroxydecanoyl-(acyl carrier protein) dehydratase
MNRAITGFHLDDEGHWVAELACGHDQHVRHDPPLQSRPWVLTESGRSSSLGVELDCLRCDLPDVETLLPHRHPFLLIDRITALNPGRRAEGIKRVTGDEWCVDAMLGAPDSGLAGGLVVEALAQLSAAVMLGLVDESTGAVGYFMGADRVRFRGTARAGDELHLTVELLRFRRGICRTRGEAWVGARRIVRAELTTVIRPAEPARAP